MAKVHLQREWYRPKRPVIHYVSNQRVLIRARPAKVRNPQTEAQQANRRKLSVASRFLAPLQDFVAKGFRAGKRPNGRPIGAYHVALGHLLSNAMKQESGQWRIDYANVKLSEGQSLREFPMRVNRLGRTLRLSWDEGLPEGSRRIRLAFHDAASGASLCLAIEAPRKGAVAEVLLPKSMKSNDLHLWWSPEVSGKTRWGCKYLFLPKGVKIVVGWVVVSKRRAAGVLSPSGSMADSAASRRGGISTRERDIGAWEGG